MFVLENKRFAELEKIAAQRNVSLVDVIAEGLTLSGGKPKLKLERRWGNGQLNGYPSDYVMLHMIVSESFLNDLSEEGSRSGRTLNDHIHAKLERYVDKTLTLTSALRLQIEERSDELRTEPPSGAVLMRHWRMQNGLPV